MNEPACTFVCAIFSAVGAVLFGYILKTGDASPMPLAMASALVVVLLSGMALTYRYV